MVDVTAGLAAAPGSGLPSFSDIGKMLKRGDIALAFGILTILVVLILPLPSLVLDLFLAISITLSILILMTSLFIQAPLEFSSFPTILLISTMLRLSLNLASTRLILSRGHRAPMPPATSSRRSAISSWAAISSSALSFSRFS
jgi:flagellar biosynthesis protein FlhA